jgi:DNA-binding response OmpR family regulator
MIKILIIEDEPQVRENIQEILDLSGFDTTVAENGKKGLDVAKDICPDLILCDLMMPELDGYSVLTELRKDKTTAAIPFIFLTARAELSDLRTGMELGADDYLTKPFLLDDLLKTIATRLYRQASVEQKN